MPANLGNSELIAFVPITDSACAREFYVDRLGLEFVSEEPPYALVVKAHGIMLRLVIVKEHQPLPGTVLGWRVDSVSAAVDDLAAAGVQVERFGFLPQDEKGIWTTPTGAKVAWFKDQDGNTLSVSEHPEWKA